MKQFFNIFFFSILVSCRTSENNHTVQSIIDDRTDSVVVKNYLKQSKESDKEISNISCLDDNQEFQFYKKMGEIKQIEENQIVCFYSSDSLNIKALFIDCKMIYRSIQSSNSKARSFSKYHNNILILYDSTDFKGNQILFYDRAVNKVMYNGSIHKPGLELLPKYIQEEINKTK